jgi:hypothetical protein
MKRINTLGGFVAVQMEEDPPRRVRCAYSIEAQTLWLGRYTGFLKSCLGFEI